MHYILYLLKQYDNFVWQTDQNWCYCSLIITQNYHMDSEDSLEYKAFYAAFLETLWLYWEYFHKNAKNYII